MSCFNAEITGKINDMSTLDDDDTEDLQDRLAPTILFTFSDDSEPKTDKQPNPKAESSPMDSAEPSESGSVFSSFWAVVTFVLALFCGLLVGVCTETYKSILYCLKKGFSIFFNPLDSCCFHLFQIQCSQRNRRQHVPRRNTSHTFDFSVVHTFNME